ncbi:MAG: IPT/TIG domain-containing protein [Myxococcota bacterium]
MALTVTDVNPTYSKVAGGGAVTITGTDFTQKVRVKFGDTTAKKIVRVSATQITAEIPKAAVGGEVQVTVTNDAGTLWDGGPTVAWGTNFTYYPTVTSIEPPAGRITGDTNLTITGEGFPVGAEVHIDGFPALNTVRVSDTQITCTTRQHAEGRVRLFVFNPGDNQGFYANFHFRKPMISGASPVKATVGGGTDVTIDGDYFPDGATVRFDGAVSPNVDYTSEQRIVARTPNHVAGSVRIQVVTPVRAPVPPAPPVPQVPGVAAATSALDRAFEYSAAEITSIEPAQGPATGGTDVTIKGRGFLVLIDDSAQVGGVPLTGVNVVDANTITGTTDAANAPGASDVSVRNNNGEAAVTLAGAFTYVAQATVTKANPASGPAGTAITIEGTAFVEGATVSVGGVAATNVEVASETAIKCVVGAHDAGQVNVEVTNPDGPTGRLDNGFTYTALAIEPARGLPAGGEQVTIKIPGPVGEDVVVQLGDNQADRVQGNEFRVTTPQHDAGAVDVSVGEATLDDGFTYSSVTRIEPNAGPATTTVTIHGAGFDETTTVSIGGNDAAPVTVVSANEINVAAPVHDAGAVDVVVGGAGAGTFAGGYTYQAAATVTGIEPDTATYLGGTEITITGTGFIEGAAVSIDGNDVTDIEVVSPTTIKGKVPVIPEGAPYAAVDVEVTNPGAAQVTGDDLFTYRSAPVVTAAANPAQGNKGGGRSITITGTGFVDGAKVLLDGEQLPGVIFDNATTLRVRVPAHDRGQVPIAVHNPRDPNPGAARDDTFEFVDELHTPTGDNEADFLMDGEEYFTMLQALFEEVREAPVDPKGLTYVRLAFWMICDDVTLGDQTDFGKAEHTLLKYIEKVVHKGHHVEIIMWRPKIHEQQFGEGQGVFEANDKFAKEVYKIDVAMADVEGSGRARVYFESYEGEVGASNHQKMAIFSIGGQRQVMIGGINLSQGYFASDDHRFPDPTAGGTPWHDAAVYLRGPITDDIEREWMRRWDRTRDLESSLWGFANLLGSDGEFLARDFALFNDTVVRQRAIATERNETIQDSHGDNRDVTIVRTRSISNGLTVTRHTWLRDKVIERINGSDNTIYFENYHFSDPDVVRAVYERHETRSGAGADLKLVVLIPGNMSPTSSYMTRRAWLQCALRFEDGTTNTPYTRSVVYDDGGVVREIQRNDCIQWDVHDCYDPDEPLATKWLENDSLTFRTNVAGPTEIRFSDILAVDTDLHFYAPYYITAGMGLNMVYTHSKIASFDDTWLVVGSANWSFRSMQYDGEISAFINDAGIAAASVQQLLRHFNTHVVAPIPLATVETLAMNNAGALVGDRFMMLPADIYNPGDLGNPYLKFSRAVPRALEVRNVVDFFSAPSEPNYTWL